MDKKVLLFGITELPEILAIRGALLALHVDVVPVSAGDWGHTLGFLAGNPKGSPQVRMGSKVNGKMMVLCNLDLDRDLDGVLQALNTAGFGAHVLKAVLNGTNQAWTPGMLEQELRKERSAIRGR